MIGRTTGRRSFDTPKSKHFEIEFIDERLNDSDRILLADIVIEPFGEQCALGSVFTFYETLHGFATQSVLTISILSYHVFTQPRPVSDRLRWPLPLRVVRRLPGEFCARHHALPVRASI